MISANFLFFLFLLSGGIGIAAALILDRRVQPRVIAAAGTVMGILTFIIGMIEITAGKAVNFSLWNLPGLGTMQAACDDLSAFFLIISGLIIIPVSLFSVRYLQSYAERINLKVFSISYLGLIISVAVIPIAGDIFSFLLAWEAMTLLCYLLVNSDLKDDRSQRAGFLMLALNEAGTLIMLASFLLLANAAGTITFKGIKLAIPHIDRGFCSILFVLSFLGFSVKVGLVPFNSWIPRAYEITPATVAALLSGVVLNLGIYGIIRVNLDILPAPSAWAGLVMLVTGAVSALVGILYATIENNLKKLLAYSSIENAGIIITGLGAGSLFLVYGKHLFASMAFIAAFYHIINHSFFKSLLFLGAGTIDTSAGTSNLDRMGGLLKKMPWTGLFMLAGSLAISAIPPFNGFVSEWLTLETLLRSVELSSIGIKIAFGAAGVALALTAGLAVTCFVRAFAMGFLGIPRSETIRSRVRETTKFALIPMAFLTLVCLGLGITPTYVIPSLNRVVAPLTGTSGTEALVPNFFKNQQSKNGLTPEFASEFHDLGARIGRSAFPVRGLAVIHRGGKENPVVFAMSTSYMFIALLFLIGSCVSIVWIFSARRRQVSWRPVWAGGVRRFLPEMTYTATGFAHPVRVIFEAVFRPKTADRHKAIAEYFRIEIHKERREIYLGDRMIRFPLAAAARWMAAKLALMHSGRINTYAGYVLLTLLIFLSLSAAM